MKKSSLFCLIALFMMACSDTIEEYITYEKQTPIFVTVAEFRNKPIGAEAPHALKDVGKIYTYNQYLFVNERGKGIHIIDNSNPSAPIQIKFLNIVGNVDMAVRNGILYADCVVDLVRFDVTNPAQPIFLSREVNVLPNLYPEFNLGVEYVVVGVIKEIIKEKRNFSTRGGFRFGGMYSASSSSDASFSPSNSPNVVGKGGSMARFAIVNDYLYAVTQSSIITFNVAQESVQRLGTFNLSAGGIVETIFPYNNNLFIGCTNGMYILGLSNPASPQQLSFVGHFPSCDPVVVEGNYAYITLRVGTNCQNATNELQVYDITNLQSPQRVKTYPMILPHGLGIQNNTLFICEGKHGLKVFDASNKQEIDKNLKQHINNVHAYDVIPMGNVLMMIGENGLFQYSISNSKTLQLLSSLRVN